MRQGRASEIDIATSRRDEPAVHNKGPLPIVLTFPAAVLRFNVPPLTVMLPPPRLNAPVDIVADEDIAHVPEFRLKFPAVKSVPPGLIATQRIGLGHRDRRQAAGHAKVPPLSMTGVPTSEP